MKDKYYIVDISGKVIIYDEALFNAVSELAKNVRLFYPTHGLLSLVPKRYRSNNFWLKRLVKVAEGGINYLYLLFNILFKRPDILHFQWLPYMEVCGWELPILNFIKKLSPRTKLILTIHNVYPHDMSDKGKAAYNVRFREACALLNEFIVHTETSRQDVIREFGIDPQKVNVCCHGVFVPKDYTPNAISRDDGKLHILQFGGQSYYKGTDVLIDAVCGLDRALQEKIETHIVGGISEKFLNELKEKDKDSVVTWKPYFLDDAELYEEINNCDLIVLPYRAISQSGVLLLSIYFEKLIICSDLPSFKETMHGGEGDDLDADLFFKNEDADSMRKLIARYINKEIDEYKVRSRIKRLKKLYSWESAAKSTINVYHKMGNNRED
ncbi:MAG: glycosyltransferase [Paludibacteraceae bacterium]|nr:glycosyltransferase [Paludibacteraceae bacterium]